MRKNTIKLVLGVMLLAVLMLAFAPTSAVAQTYTKTYGSGNRVEVSGFGYLYRFNQTFSTMNDTVNINLPKITPGDIKGADTTLYRVNIFTSDTIYISVRYQISSDNVNWQSYTIGTDSTTWAWGAAVAPVRTMNTFVISAPQYGGAQPYTRLKVFGYPPTGGRHTGYTGKLQVDLIPLRQKL